MRSRLLGPSSAWESSPGGKKGPKSNSRWQRLCCRRIWTRRPRAARRERKAGKKGVCMTSIYTCHWLDRQPIIKDIMKKKLVPPDLQHQYRQLRSRLASTGYISQGSVLDRSTLRPPRSGYQWTRKVARKTITVALAPEQFHSLRKAIDNRRQLEKTIREMEKLSRRILFGTLPDTRRHKSLSKRVLGII